MVKAKDEDISGQILAYLIDKNRPFSATDVSMNLGKPKLLTTRTLTELADSKSIEAKQYGKQWVFAPPKPTQVIQPDDQFGPKLLELETEAAGVNGIVSALATQLNELNSTPTDDGLVQAVNTLLSENALLEAKLKTLESNQGQAIISDEDRDALEADLVFARKEWKTRKALFKEINAAVLEGVQGPLSEFYENLGIETDEFVKVSIDAFV